MHGNNSPKAKSRVSGQEEMFQVVKALQGRNSSKQVVGRLQMTSMEPGGTQIPSPAKGKLDLAIKSFEASGELNLTKTQGQLNYMLDRLSKRTEEELCLFLEVLLTSIFTTPLHIMSST